MLKAIALMFKLCAFALVVLVAGAWIKWDGRTLSDHVRRHVTRAERSEVADHLRGWTRKVTRDAREGFDKQARARGWSTSSHPAAPAPREGLITDRAETEAAAPAHPRSEEKLPPSERQKLRALIKELNSS